MNELFDPLENIGHVDPEQASATKKREIQNILKSYVGFFDPFSELIQNAMDAVDARSRKNEDKDYQPLLWITVDIRQKRFSVTDNGIGFEKRQFETFLAPDITYKSGGKTRGKKGVGATYIAYGFNALQLGTKSKGYHQVANFVGGRNWVDDSGGIHARPKATSAEPYDPAFATIDSGSTFVLTIDGADVRPKDLTWIGATNATQWASILQIKTPLGYIRLDDNQDEKRIKFNITVVDANGDETKLEDQTAGYILPHSVVASSVDLSDIRKNQALRMARGQDLSKLPRQAHEVKRGVPILVDRRVGEAPGRARCRSDGVAEALFGNSIWILLLFREDLGQIS